MDRPASENEPEFIDRLVKFTQAKIGGYSISHVSGRFRAADIKTREEVGKMFSLGAPYLIDETTAVARFIIPCHSSVLEYENDFKSIGAALDASRKEDPSLVREVRQIRRLFYHLFVEAVARTVGEQEIWLLEQSPFGQRLYVWARK